jgi:hypothetical protein
MSTYPELARYAIRASAADHLLPLACDGAAEVYNEKILV